jgi:beta-glucanase (GH16 family)
VLAFDDEFTQDAAIDTTKWNFSAANTPVCGGNLVPLPPPHSDCEQYNLGASVNSITGLNLQPVVDINNANTYGGYTSTINSSTKFSQRYGYWEWSAQLPHDNAGEGDGLHPTIYLRPNGQRLPITDCTADNGEVDVTESDIGPAKQTYTFYGVHDYCEANDIFLQYPSGGTLGSGQTLANGFHTYGLFWRNDGSAHGSVQAYFDGVAQGTPHSFYSDSTLWDNGAYTLLDMDPCVGSAFFGGVTCSTKTSNSNPFMIRYMRVWQFQPD